MLSQIIRFTLPSTMTISTPLFLKLREASTAAGAVAQYYGYTSPTKFAPLPRKRHEICWVIQWPDECDRSSVMKSLHAVADDATTLLINFNDNQLSELNKALDAPICEFATIRLSDDAPLSNPALQRSMHKTYTDAYQMLGFTGGQWAYVANTNEVAGISCSGTAGPVVPEGQRRFGIYYLGWESIELHQDGTKTTAFSEELEKLMPYFGPGTGAWYAMFRRH